MFDNDEIHSMFDDDNASMRGYDNERSVCNNDDTDIMINNTLQYTQYTTYIIHTYTKHRTTKIHTHNVHSHQHTIQSYTQHTQHHNAHLYTYTSTHNNDDNNDNSDHVIM